MKDKLWKKFSNDPVVIEMKNFIMDHLTRFKKSGNPQDEKRAAYFIQLLELYQNKQYPELNPFFKKGTEKSAAALPTIPQIAKPRTIEEKKNIKNVDLFEQEIGREFFNKADKVITIKRPE